mgnify:CR=1 FL=1
MAGQNTRQAKGRLKRLERLMRDERLLRPRERKIMRVKLGDTLRSGDRVLMTDVLAVGYPDHGAPLFDVPDLVLQRGEVAALIGANGTGKSTFVKTIIGQLAPLSGQTRLGAAVVVGYFAQAHEALVENNSLIDEITSVKPMPISEARHYLAQYLFQADDVFRLVSSPSGGERGRVALAKLALSGANFLLLDEPTNHLDIESQEVLQNVLADFPGTILIVSHDRYLIDALATQIWWVTPGQMRVYSGSYREFLDTREREKEVAAAPTAAAKTRSSTAAQTKPHRSGLNPFQLQRRLAELEAHIETLEGEIVSLAQEIERASAAGNAARVRDLGEHYTRLENERDETLSLWAELAD